MKLHLPNPLKCFPIYTWPARATAATDASELARPAATQAAALPTAMHVPSPAVNADWEALRTTLNRKNAMGMRPVKAVAMARAFVLTHGVAAINREPSVAYALVAFVAAQKTVVPTPRHMPQVDDIVTHLRAQRWAILSLDIEALLTLHGQGSEDASSLAASDAIHTLAPLLREACAGVPGLYSLCLKTAQHMASSSGASLGTCIRTLQAFASTSLRQDSLREWLRSAHLPQLARSNAALLWLGRLAQRPQLRDAAFATQVLGVVQNLLDQNVSASSEQLDRFVESFIPATPHERSTLCATGESCPAALFSGSREQSTQRIAALVQVPAFAQLLAGASKAEARSWLAHAVTLANQLGAARLRRRSFDDPQMVPAPDFTAGGL